MMTVSLLPFFILGLYLSGSCRNEFHKNVLVQYENFSCPGWHCMNEPSPEHVDGDIYLKTMGCFCDDLCDFFDDCCDDYDNTKSKHLDKKLRNSIQCTHHCMVSPETQYYAVTKCPSEYPNKEVSDLCSTTNTSDLFLQIPATGKTTGLMYKNIFCAQCHLEDAELWLFYVKCQDHKDFDLNKTTNVSYLLQRSNCLPKFLHVPNTTYLRPCHRNTITLCPFCAGQVLDKACQGLGQKLVYTENGVYKNTACAICNNQTSPRCVGIGQRLPCERFMLPWAYYSISLLFDISSGRGTKVVSDISHLTNDRFDTNHSCTSFQIYDPFNDICRTVTCDKNYTFVNGHCEGIMDHNVRNSTSYDYGKFSICPRVTLNQSEFMILVDGRLLETSSKRIHDPADFIFEGDNAVVCAVDLTNSSKLELAFIVVSIPTFSSLEGIISGTGIIVSLTALLLTVVVYIALRSLRNIPGCNIMCLSISLFVAELMMLIAPTTEHLPRVCKIFGIGMHYFFLVAFMWMNVIAIDALSTFTGAMRYVRRPHSLTIRFTIYSLYSWIVPLVPVITATLMDIFLPLSLYAPGYGQDVCWIRNKLSAIAFFAAPLAFIILMNIILFTMTSATICSVKKSSARKLGGEDRGELLIYIKLFVVMGLTWILGFLSAFVPHPVTTYLYIVVNSLQGLFIGISFVCTRKVLNLFRERLSRRRM